MSCSPPKPPKLVILQEWWLTKIPNSDNNGKSLLLGVSGITCDSQWKVAERCFSSAPILHAISFFALQTVDDIYIHLRNKINKDRTLENGFSPEVFNDFDTGFPPEWEELVASYLKRGSSAKCVSRVSVHEDGKHYVERHADILDNLKGKQKHCDNFTRDTGVQERADTVLSKKSSTVPNIACSLESPHKDIIESAHEVLCERSPMRSEFEDKPSFRMSPLTMDAQGIKHEVAIDVVDSFTVSKCPGVSSSHRIVSMTKMDKVAPIDSENLGSSDIFMKEKSDALSDNKAANVDLTCESMKTVSTLHGSGDKPNLKHISPNFSVVCGKGSIEAVNCSEDMDTNMSEQIQSDQGAVEDQRKKLIGEIGISNQGKNEYADVHGESHVDSQEGASNAPDSTDIIDFQEAIVTKSKPKRKLTSESSAKRQLIAGSESSKSTSEAKKGSKETHNGAIILSPESFSGKRSRSGRVLLPRLEFWRNQKVIYDQHRQVCGVQEPN